MKDELAMTLEARLRRLERLNRLLIGGLAMAGAAIAVFSCASSRGAAESIRARRLDIVNANGMRQATLMSDDKGAWLVLEDAGGTTRVAIGAAKERSGIELYGDKAGQIKATMTSDPDGAVVGVADDQGRLRLSLGFFQKNSWLAVYDQALNKTYSIPPQ